MKTIEWSTNLWIDKFKPTHSILNINDRSKTTQNFFSASYFFLFHVENAFWRIRRLTLGSCTSELFSDAFSFSTNSPLSKIHSTCRQHRTTYKKNTENIMPNAFVCAHLRLCSGRADELVTQCIIASVNVWRENSMWWSRSWIDAVCTSYMCIRFVESSSNFRDDKYQCDESNGCLNGKHFKTISFVKHRKTSHTMSLCLDFAAFIHTSQFIAQYVPYSNSSGWKSVLTQGIQRAWFLCDFRFNSNFNWRF